MCEARRRRRRRNDEVCASLSLSQGSLDINSQNITDCAGRILGGSGKGSGRLGTETWVEAARPKREEEAYQSNFNMKYKYIWVILYSQVIRSYIQNYVQAEHYMSKNTLILSSFLVHIHSPARTHTRTQSRSIVPTQGIHTHTYTHFLSFSQQHTHRRRRLGCTTTVISTRRVHAYSSIRFSHDLQIGSASSVVFPLPLLLLLA